MSPKCFCLSTMRDIYFMLRKIEDPNEQDKIWKEWTAGMPHTHNALDDARSQAQAFYRCRDSLTSLTTV